MWNLYISFTNNNIIQLCCCINTHFMLNYIIMYHSIKRFIAGFAILNVCIACIAFVMMLTVIYGILAMTFSVIGFFNSKLSLA